MVLRHPLTLITKETRPINLTASNTCLLLQDLHAPFADPENGWLARRVKEKVLSREFDEYFELLAIISQNIPKVLRAARDLGMPVVFSSLGHDDNNVSDFQQATGWSWDLNGEDGSYPAAWEPREGEFNSSQAGVECTIQSRLRSIFRREQHRQRSCHGRYAGLRHQPDVP